MGSFPPSISPTTFTSSAAFIGILLTNDLTINEQLAIAEWFRLVAQSLISNAYWLAVLKDRNIYNQGETLEKTETGPTFDPDDFDILIKTINTIQQQLNQLSKDIND